MKPLTITLIGAGALGTFIILAKGSKKSVAVPVPEGVLPTKTPLVYSPGDAPRKIPGKIASPRAQAAAAAANPVNEVLRLTNEYRAKFGVQTLVWSDLLGRSAQVHALDMAERGFFAHNNPDGEQPQDRMIDVGWNIYPMGENIAAGQVSPADVMQGWINSPGHRANLVRREFKHIGIALYQSPDSVYKYYWVQNFGG